MNATTEKTVSCRVKKCNHPPFTGEFAVRAEIMHYHRVHSKSIQMAREGKRKYKKRAKVATSRFSMRNGMTKFKGLKIEAAGKKPKLNKDGSPDKRSQAYRNAHPEIRAHLNGNNRKKAKTIVQDQAIHFCPNCLTNLMAVATGLVKSGQQHLHVNGCPVCGCNIKAVAEEIVTSKVK